MPTQYFMSSRVLLGTAFAQASSTSFCDFGGANALDLVGFVGSSRGRFLVSSYESLQARNSVSKSAASNMEVGLME